MKIIVGLGNPGDRYKNTRHNVGFMVVDALAEKLNVQFDHKLRTGVYAKYQDLIIAKPLTYMNNSGFFVRELLNFFKEDIKNVVIVYDDLDFSVGQAVMRLKGSSGGQNGMKSIIEQTGTTEIKRLKIGIGRQGDAATYVLSPFDQQQKAKIDEVIKQAVEILMFYHNNSFLSAVEVFNVNKDKA